MTAPAPLSGGDARTQPTDDERETAIDALGYRGRTYGEIPGSFVYHVDAVAQALADQRARYRRIADERAAEALEALAAELVRDGRPDLTTVAEVEAVSTTADLLDARAASLRAGESA